MLSKIEHGMLIKLFNKRRMQQLQIVKKKSYTSTVRKEFSKLYLTSSFFYLSSQIVLQNYFTLVLHLVQH